MYWKCFEHTYAPNIGSVGQASLLLCPYYLQLSALGRMTRTGLLSHANWADLHAGRLPGTTFPWALRSTQLPGSTDKPARLARVSVSVSSRDRSTTHTPQESVQVNPDGGSTIYHFDLKCACLLLQELISLFDHSNRSRTTRKRFGYVTQSCIVLVWSAKN